MISSMVTVNRLGQIKPSTKASISMAKNTAKGRFYGKMTAAMKASSSKIIFMATANIFGKMVGLTKVSGRTIKWTEKAFLLG